MKKWLLFCLLYIPLLGVLFIYRNEIMDWSQTHASYTILTILTTVFAIFPVLPFKLIIALLGYAFGPVMGGIVSWLGTMISSLIMYGVFRWLLSSKGDSYLKQIPGVKGLTTMMQEQTFSAVLLARMIPIIPQMAVNVYAGTAALPFWSYMIASGIGRLPSIALYAYAGKNAAEHPLATLTIFIIYLLLLVLAFVSYRIRLKQIQEDDS